MSIWFNRIILVLMDMATIVLSIFFSFFLCTWYNCFEEIIQNNLQNYLQFILLYAVIFILFYVEGIYTKRYDFWQEIERITKGIFLSALIIFAIHTFIRQSEIYSHIVLLITFVTLILVLPFQKFFLKRFLFNIGLWRHKAAIVGNDPFFEEHVFTNPYLGYVKTDYSQANTLFISSSKTIQKLENILHDALIRRQEIIFIPMIKNYDFSNAHIIHLFNARTNLIIVENSLIDRSKQTVKFLLDYLLALLLFPILLAIMGVIALFIKYEEPDGSIFFTQKRLGQNGDIFECYKFRSMRENSLSLLNVYLTKHPEEVKNYEVYHKYENDPRITKIGAFLRKTSLDELPQILNVLKLEMSLIGPRPYMPNERNKMGNDADIILTVKPGITGLWQVSGRNNLDFMSRVKLDIWYVRNWSIWNDIIILIKTVQVVLLQKGAS